MNMPFFKFGLFETNISLIIAVILGIGFGIFLEKGGFGNAKKLAGQFYLHDFTVFKGMFTAILVAMLGVFWLYQFGLMDTTKLYMNPTYIFPQLVAGLVFGVGFVMAGLCPGTAIVSAATGKTDGIITLIGVLLGIFIFGEIFDFIKPFYYSTAMGPVSISQISGASYGLIVLIIVVLALMAFFVIGKFERRKSLFVFKPSITLKVIGGIVLCLGIIAGFIRPSYYSVHKYQDQVSGVYINQLEVKEIGVHKLAEWIMQKKENIVLLDSRTLEEFNQYHIPSNNTIHISRIEKTAFYNANLIVYSNNSYDGLLLNELLDIDSANIYFLKGGIDSWIKYVLFPDLSLSHLNDSENKKLKMISNYFGGKSFVREQLQSKTTKKFSREGC